MTNYGREPVASRISKYNSDLYLYLPDATDDASEAKGVVQRAIHTPLSNLGNVTASNVLKGYTFTSSAGLKVSGTAYLKPTTTTTGTIISGGASSVVADVKLIKVDTSEKQINYTFTLNINGGSFGNFSVGVYLATT